MFKTKFFALTSVAVLGLSIMVPLTEVVHASERSTVPEASIVAVNSAVPDVDESRIDSLDTVDLQNFGVVDISQLSPDQLDNFKQAARYESEKVPLQTKAEKEAYYQALLSLYDINSENHGDFNKVTQELISQLNSISLTRSGHGWISVPFAASAFNLAINLVTGGVASAGVKALIKKYGTQKALDLLKRKIIGAVAVWGVKQITGINTIIKVVATALDPGTAIAKAIDARDKIPNNGYLEFT
ncbi:hypothetical protein F6X86_07055 [Enterococcus durans]|uniref:hypothetical protein n=1 Tax=Enterococcus TaxID=1350 RepID=UPI000F50A787|nr:MULTISPECIES: hypothetical protein [Enterococcus]KAA9178981.1 hypothetical protein F6X86_07055 [Enterococcus durans]KAA9185556.1 hypothetical protein F6X85_07720 [Enterococcus durans]KAA9186603.1 hypothetical protein F6X90_06310 [Enterococcus durans]KAA9191408.1 hypothetical protein F6Y12_06195 [Enterococcus durans]KAA9193478.1 hypothetical protein F6X88_06350 [Enterococcus durans]